MTKENPQLNQLLIDLFASGPNDSVIEKANQELMIKMETVFPQKIHYSFLANTPLGKIWIAASEKGLVAVDYDLSEKQFIQELSKKIKARFIKDDDALQVYRERIVKYLIGEIHELDVEIDFSILSPFQKAVLLAAKDVPRGKVSTYGKIAKQVDKPRAFQAVGQALRHNPIPIALPCHRVIASDGSLGGYSGEMNSNRKKKLLQIEGVLLF